MRDRHFPRICGSCESPLARQEKACWHCGTPWATEDEPTTVLRLIQGGGMPDYRELPLAVSAALAIPIGPTTDDGGEL